MRALPRTADRPEDGTARRARAVFLDRDGVINRAKVRNGKPYAPRRVADFRLLPGAAASIAMLKTAGFLVVVVTNQPDIGNGLVAAPVVEAMHRRLKARTGVDDIRTCPHSQEAGCACRKPKAGMLRAAARRWGIDLRRSYMIGDRTSDIVAGQRAGCYTILVERGYAERPQAAPDARVRSLRQAVAVIGKLEGSLRG
jgi:D-glycero-D-manno-heptose 1,7-bisphosphate phosphatase